jgi:hypothetical protein
VGEWLEVMGEMFTLSLVASGRSIARYGDGELNLCHGRSIPCQAHSPVLQRRLLDILQDSGECLVGIPNIHSATPKAEFWGKYKASARLLAYREYGSAFISRPDSAPWIDTPEYWALLESLWKDRDVTLVRGADSERGLFPSDLVGARSVREVLAPRRHAFADYDKLLDLIGTPDLALLCVGPTATVLAVDLCARGVHAVDIGHVGLFLRKVHRGEPAIMTAADKALV